MNKLIITIFVLLMLAQTGIADTLTINGGNNYTNNLSVNITISVDGQDYGWVAGNNGTYFNVTANTTTQWIFNTSTNEEKTFTLTKEQDDFNISFTSKIILDRIDPVVNMIFPVDNSTYFQDEISSTRYLSLEITDTIDDNGNLESLPFVDYGILGFWTGLNQDIPIYAVNSSSIIHNEQGNFTLSNSLGEHKIQVLLKDSAGNYNHSNFTYNVVSRTVSSGNIVRSLELNYIIDNSLINVTLTPTNGDFQIYNINETIPVNFNVSFVNSSGENFNISMEKVANTPVGYNTYKFIGAEPLTNLTYSINTTSSNYGQFYISGTFIDADRKSGIIAKSYYHFASAQIELYQRYDSNDNGVLEKGEVINAVVDYFKNELTFSEIMKIVIKYLFGSIFN